MTVGPEWGPSVERFSGYAAEYDLYRPSAPEILLDVICELASTPKPEMVVDLGCGTGVSTRVGADRAGTVLGIDPSDDMLTVANARPAGNVKYRLGLSHDIELEDESADVVTCGMSLRWMDPELTAAKIIRILRPGGVFASYSYHWHCTTIAIQDAYTELMETIEGLGGQNQASGEIKRWPKRLQEETIEKSSTFQMTRLIGLHSIESFDAHGLAGFIKTFGVTQNVIKTGISDEESGLAAFQRAVQNVVSQKAIRLVFTWHLWVAVKR